MPHYVLDARTATPHFPGIGRYCRSIAPALITLLTPDERLSILHASAHPLDLPAHPGVTSIPLDISPFSLRQQWGVPHILSQLDADVYHSAYYLMPYHPGVPALVTFYDLIPIRFPKYSTLRARLLFRLASRLALKTAHKGFVISSTVQQDLVRYMHADPEKLIHTPLAAAPQFTPQFPEVAANIREEYALPSRFILYLGSNKPHKNLNRLVQAYGPLRNLGIPLVIAGTWLPLYPESRQLADALERGGANMFIVAAGVTSRRGRARSGRGPTGRGRRRRHPGHSADKRPGGARPVAGRIGGAVGPMAVPCRGGGCDSNPRS